MRYKFLYAEKSFSKKFSKERKKIDATTMLGIFSKRERVLNFPLPFGKKFLAEKYNPAVPKRFFLPLTKRSKNVFQRSYEKDISTQ
ncbi:MAG TPA: hypothetical protein DF383_07410 [Deltaproteobacteria bacterium]|nr:hypothetical protein [Deltaproteobacteria bacterium]